MKIHRKWVALFTQSGSEIYEISRQVGFLPDIILTNKPVSKIDTINPKLLSVAFDRIIFAQKIPTAQEYSRVMHNSSIITLHGYLRILPSEVCNSYKIYNGHPGIITHYPELKGKDPQKRVWDSKDPNYKYHGHVIHEVTAEVDEGKIVSASYFSCIDLHSEYTTLDEYINRLRVVGISNWVNFFRRNNIHYNANEYSYFPRL